MAAGHRLYFLFLAACACAPGSLEWASGEDHLRTAHFTRPATTGLPHTVVLLSTGEFACTFPASSSAQEQSEALAALHVGACREGTRHVVLDLYRAPDTPEEGVYTLISPGPEAFDPERFDPALTPRVAMAWYLGIEEARAQLRGGLLPRYEPLRITEYISALEHAGSVELRQGGDRLVGRFDLPEAHVSGQFRATECSEGETSLFDFLIASPTASCALFGE